MLVDMGVDREGSPRIAGDEEVAEESLSLELVGKPDSQVPPGYMWFVTHITRCLMSSYMI